jgi:hypothetical protein
LSQSLFSGQGCLSMRAAEKEAAAFWAAAPSKASFSFRAWQSLR